MKQNTPTNSYPVEHFRQICFHLKKVCWQKQKALICLTFRLCVFNGLLNVLNGQLHHILISCLNPVVPNAPFLYPLEISENLTVFNICRGQRKGALGTNGLKKVIIENAYCENGIFYHIVSNTFPAGIYLLQANNGNTRTVWEICYN